MQNPNKTNSTEIIAALQARQSDIVETLYDSHRNDFLKWAGNRFRTTSGDIEDAWQEALITFYEQATSRKLTVLHCSVRTYLFAIGFKYLLKNHRKINRIMWQDEVDEAINNDPYIATLTFDDPWEQERDIMRAAMNDLLPRCRELLVRRHYDEQSVTEIMEAYQYASVNTVSVSLSKCLASLKKIIETKIKK